MTTKLQPYPKYKPSGIDWLGDIPERWEITKLRREAIFQSGHGFPNEIQGRDEGEYPFLKVSDINGEQIHISSARNYINYPEIKSYGWKKIPVGSILTAKIGAALAVNHRKVNDVECIIDNNMLTFILRRGSRLNHGYFFMVSKVFDLNWFVNPGAVPSVNLFQLKELTIPVPKKEEQKQIAEFLDEKTKIIDELVAKKEKLIELLREKRAALITRAVTKGLPAEASAKAGLDPNAKLKPSGIDWLGDIPEGWETQRLKFCLRLINERGLSDSENKIALENIEGGTGKYIETDSNYEGGTRFDKNDVLFGKLRPYLTKVFLAQNGGEAVGDILVYRANKKILPKFAFYFFLSDGFIDIVNSSTFGAKMPRAESFFIGNLIFIYPDIKNQERVADFLDTETGRIDKTATLIESQIEKLKEYRSSLIYHAVTGKIRA